MCNVYLMFGILHVEKPKAKKEEEKKIAVFPPNFPSLHCLLLTVVSDFRDPAKPLQLGLFQKPDKGVSVNLTGLAHTAAKRAH